ncbi:MAG: hypothetical protein M3162_01905 [Thermoproteota archaeon]|nr:hypothetical protein [Thermoproteota archaeon]
MPSNGIKRLTYGIIKSMIDKTNQDLKTPVKFVEVYEDACKKRIKDEDELERSNLEMRQHVRDNLIRNGYVFVDPADTEAIYITQKAVDECNLLLKEILDNS